MYKTTKSSKKKFLLGLALSLVMAMAIGSFAIGETQTPVTPQVVSTNDGDTGAFNVEGGTYGDTEDYHFEGTTEQNGVLYIHPKSSETSIKIENKDKSIETKDRIEITAGPNDTEKAVNITLNGVNINTYDGQYSTDMGAAFKIAYNAEFNVNITLADNSKNYLTSDNYSAGLDKSDDKTTEADIAKLGTLTIGVPSDSTLKNGMLEANEPSESTAGIGGGMVYDDARKIWIGRNASNITITGGVVTANGGQYGAGIGGGDESNGNYITISGGTVTANGGYGGAGIGGGNNGGVSTDVNGSHITITGGTVTANGGGSAAGIGGGGNGQGTDITITGGTVTAIGGFDEPIPGQYQAGSGIGGGGHQGTGSKNTISGGAVVMAASGDTTVKDALEGFDAASEGKIEQSIIFKGVATAFDSGGRATAESWTESEMYDNVVLSENLEIPIDLTIPAGKTLSIKESKAVALTGKDNAKYTVEGTLQNDGTVTLPTNLEFGESGKVTTLLKYDKQGGSFSKDSDYQLYQDKAGKNKTYQELPQPATNDTFNGWFTKAAGAGNKIDEATGVDLNLHQVYADMDYVVTFDSQGGSDVSPVSPIKYKGKVTKPASDPTREDYKFDGWYKEAECINKWDFDEDTVQGDTTIYAGWIYNPTPTPPGPEPQPTPPGPQPGPEPTPEPTPDPSVNPDGDGSGSSSKTSDPFMEGTALALLGITATGAVILRKRK